MDLEAFDALATSLPGVRRTCCDGLVRWQVGGRLLARQLDRTRVVVRVPFEVRDLLLHRAPEVFTVPTRLARHMSVVADLAATGVDAAGGGTEDAARAVDAVEDAVTAAWRLQTGTSREAR